MTRFSKRFLIGAVALSVLGGATSLAMAYGPMGGGDCGGMHGGKSVQSSKMGERMAQHMKQRQDELKKTLKLTPAQESAWTAYTKAMEPTGKPAAPVDMAELQKLPAPQRMEKMQSLHQARQKDNDAKMTQHLEATKAFYAALTPEQQKIFDTQHNKGHKSRGQGEHGKGGMHG